MSVSVNQAEASAVIPSVSEVSDKSEKLGRIKMEALSLVPRNHFYPAEFMIKLLDKYEAEDLELILKDFHLLKEKTFEHADKAKVYVVTAGGPGAGKSTYFEKFKESLGVKFAYIDPDRSCLLHMENTREIA